MSNGVSNGAGGEDQSPGHVAGGFWSPGYHFLDVRRVLSIALCAGAQCCARSSHGQRAFVSNPRAQTRAAAGECLWNLSLGGQTTRSFFSASFKAQRGALDAPQSPVPCRGAHGGFPPCHPRVDRASGHC